MKDQNEKNDFLVKELEEYLDTFYVNQVISFEKSIILNYQSRNNQISRVDLMTNQVIGEQVKLVICTNYRKSI